MANRPGKKNKKPLQTTLGKAVSHTEKDVDLSHIQKPINTSVFGLRQVLSLFQTATQEVQNYITYECDIMYECRTCRTIFRSLANFILHKRNYCREQFNQLDLLNNNDEISEDNCAEHSEEVLYEESRPLASDAKESNSNAGTKKSLDPVIERLKEKQEICQLAQKVLNQDLSSKEIVGECHESDERVKSNDLLLEEIATNNAAVFQTVLRNLPTRDTKKSEFMKSEVMEIHGILDSDEAVLGPDGKICTFETNKINKNPIIPKNDLFCTECNVKFSTKKTLTYHIKYKHNNTRLVFVCPDCKDTFANAWCVYRHLFKIHRRTSAQIKRMREQIHNSCIRKDQEPVKKKKPLEKLDKPDEENQWLSNIEGDNDFQMCGGCGKRFERKAALHSHAQMCTKRIAVCNTIKENNAKKKEEELCKDLKNKSTKADKVEVLKGSSKRKPYLLRTYKSSEEEGQDKDKVLLSEESNDNCDVNANCEIVENNCDNNKDVSEEEEKTGKIRSSLSSSEDLLSPSKKDFLGSPSIEKIDTEKMLSIIGITTDYGPVKMDKPNTQGSDSEENSNSGQDISEQSRSIDYEHVKNVDERGTESENSNSGQDISKQNDPLEGNPVEREDPPPPKTTKTVPLILRRRKNSAKCEKRNAILDNRNETNDSKLEADIEEFADVENIAQTSDSNVLDSSSSSTFKISVKSLEDLIGVSPQNHLRNLESKEVGQTPDNEVQIEDNELDHVQPRTADSFEVHDEIHDAVELNTSFETPDEGYPKCLKRKRTSSFDFSERGRFSKLSKGILLNSKRDISFISRASPFMDQNKLLCKPCQTSYPTLSKLLWHMSAHFSWFRFQCSRCSFISFNKLDCANHARKVHGVKKSSIQSVVLPIPNWKTVLMSHDFCMLDDENDLSGKHTDEILSGNSEEGNIVEISNEEHEDDVQEEPDWDSRLFVESNNAESETESDPLEPDNPACAGIKQETIDISDDAQESFQIEVPQEIYTLDVSEIMKGVNYEEREHYEPHIKIEALDDEEDISLDGYFPTHQENEMFVDEIKIKTEEMPDEDTNETLLKERNEEANNCENRECPKKHTEQSVNVRPTRNRTRSIKTIQDDFFYDLSKVIKLNDTSVSKSNLQKHKKSQRNKESASSHDKGDNQQIRVYSKRK